MGKGVPSLPPIPTTHPHSHPPPQLIPLAYIRRQFSSLIESAGCALQQLESIDSRSELRLRLVLMARGPGFHKWLLSISFTPSVPSFCLLLFLPLLLFLYILHLLPLLLLLLLLIHPLLLVILHFFLPS